MIFLYNNSTHKSHKARSVWIREFFREMAKHRHVTNDPENADFFLTELSAEANYPRFNMRGGPRRPVKGVNLVNHIESLPHYGKGKHLIFYHNGSRYNSEGVMNGGYMSDNPEDFIMTPPSLKKLNFNRTVGKKFLISFKGTIRKVREPVFNKLKGVEGVTISEKGDGHGYKGLMENSQFALCLEGHLPWSYRFSEIINAGAIPLILKEKWEHLPFHHFVDYDRFALRGECVETLVEEAKRMGKREISRRLKYMENVNKRFFINREANAKALIRYLFPGAKKMDLPMTNPPPPNGDEGCVLS